VTDAKAGASTMRLKYSRMLEPLCLKHLHLRNRLVKAPYSSTGANDDGYVGESAVPHYEAVAAGGVGLFISESVAVDRIGVSGSPRMAIWDDSYIAGQAMPAEAVHKYDVPILMQIHHAGPSYSTGTLGHWSVGTGEKLEPISASSLAHEELPGPRRNLPRAATQEEIRDVVIKFADAAERAAKAGFDGVELHFATGFLVNSFFSRAWNKRTDRYGGSIENRARIGVEIARQVRERVGDRFIICARINAKEYGAKHGDGLTHAETTRIARMLETAGVDLINVTVYGYNDLEWVFFPEQAIFPEAASDMGDFAEAVRRGDALVVDADAIKKSVSIPVIAAGGLSLDGAERALRRGAADLLAFGRALIADPDMPKKVEAGAIKDIRPCTHCMTCVDALGRSAHERCRVNAAFAKETEFKIVPAARKKTIVVIGGGPAGMEAARVAALRGHSVTLFDQNHRLGGLVPLAALIKGTEIEELPQFVRYLERQLRKLGVTTKLGTAVDEELIRRMNPDAVVVATGSSLRLPRIEGMDSRNVVTSADLLSRIQLPMRLMGTSFLEYATKFWLPLGKRVILIGGLMQGTELAEFLIKRGRQVVLTDTSDQLGTGLLEIHRTHTLRWLERKGATLLPGVKYERITKEGIHLVTQDGTSRFVTSDSIVVLATREPDFSFHNSLRAHVPDVRMVGDCNSPGMIVDAIEAGYATALTL
jgi:2,4-dienoyl-CoA reductase (NADPH2)